MARADWLFKLRISCAIYLRATREKYGVRFAFVKSEEIIQINLFLVFIISLCRWLAVDIYRAAKRRGKYPPLATSTSVNSC